MYSSSLVSIARLPGGPELSLLPVMMVFYLAIPLALLYLVARSGDDEPDRDTSTVEEETES